MTCRRFPTRRRKPAGQIPPPIASRKPPDEAFGSRLPTDCGWTTGAPEGVPLALHPVVLRPLRRGERRPPDRGILWCPSTRRPSGTARPRIPWCRKARKPWNTAGSRGPGARRPEDRRTPSEPETVAFRGPKASRIPPAQSPERPQEPIKDPRAFDVGASQPEGREGPAPANPKVRRVQVPDPWRPKSP